MATSINKQIAKNKRNTVFIMIIFIAIVSAIGALFVWLTGDERLLGIFMIIVAIHAKAANKAVKINFFNFSFVITNPLFCFFINIAHAWTFEKNQI